MSQIKSLAKEYAKCAQDFVANNRASTGSKGHGNDDLQEARKRQLALAREACGEHPDCPGEARAQIAMLSNPLAMRSIDFKTWHVAWLRAMDVFCIGRERNGVRGMSIWLNADLKHFSTADHPYQTGEARSSHSSEHASLDEIAQRTGHALEVAMIEYPEAHALQDRLRSIMEETARLKGHSA